MSEKGESSHDFLKPSKSFLLQPLIGTMALTLLAIDDVITSEMPDTQKEIIKGENWLKRVILQSGVRPGPPSTFPALYAPP